MNITAAIRLQIVMEFKRGHSMNVLSWRYSTDIETIEEIIRRAMTQADEARKGE